MTTLQLFSANFCQILDGHFSWQAQFLVTLEGDFYCSAHCKWRFICDKDQSWVCLKFKDAALPLDRLWSLRYFACVRIGDRVFFLDAEDLFSLEAKNSRKSAWMLVWQACSIRIEASVAWEHERLARSAGCWSFLQWKRMRQSDWVAMQFFNAVA